jgi:hypothetical protein
MRRTFSALFLLTATTAALGLVSGAPASAQPSLGNRNVITFPEQRVCIEDPKETNLRSKIPCYFIQHDDPALKKITGNKLSYQKDKYNIWSILLQVIGVCWIVAKVKVVARIWRWIR